MDLPGRICGVPPAAPAAPAAATTRLAGSSPSANPASSRVEELNELSPGSSERRVSILVYDNRFNGTGGVSPRHLLYRSASKLGVPVFVGNLVPASVRKWQPGDRENWLLRMLPRMTAKVVVLLDGFDTVLMCKAQELYEKWQRLAGDDKILISGEKVS